MELIPVRKTKSWLVKNNWILISVKKHEKYSKEFPSKGPKILIFNSNRSETSTDAIKDIAKFEGFTSEYLITCIKKNENHYKHFDNEETQTFKR